MKEELKWEKIFTLASIGDKMICGIYKSQSGDLYILDYMIMTKFKMFVAYSTNIETLKSFYNNRRNSVLLPKKGTKCYQILLDRTNDVLFKLKEFDYTNDERKFSSFHSKENWCCSNPEGLNLLIESLSNLT